MTGGDKGVLIVRLSISVLGCLLGAVSYPFYIVKL